MVLGWGPVGDGDYVMDLAWSKWPRTGRKDMNCLNKTGGVTLLAVTWVSIQ